MPYLFGVRDAKMAVWTDTDTYSAEIDLPAVSQFEVTLRYQTATLEGDDRIVDQFSKAIGATVRLRFAESVTLAMDIVNAITGSAIESSAGKRRVGVGDERNRYLGIIAQIMDTEDQGDNHIFLPKAKVTDGLNYSAAYGGYQIKELTLEAVSDDEYKPVYIYEHVAAEDAVIPPEW